MRTFEGKFLIFFFFQSCNYIDRQSLKRAKRPLGVGRTNGFLDRSVLGFPFPLQTGLSDNQAGAAIPFAAGLLGKI
jgi:hypothetical protein